MVNFSREVDKVLYIDWGFGTDADTSPYNYVSDYVLRGTLGVKYGRDQIRSTAPPQSESLSAVLNNQDGRFNNAAGPLAGFVNRGPFISSFLTHSSDVTIDDLDITVDDETWTVDDPENTMIFIGFVDRAPQSIDAIKSVSVSAFGYMRYFTSNPVTIPLLENVTIDTILDYICDIVGFPANLRHFDEGDVVIEKFWMVEQIPLPMMVRLLATEGSNSIIYTDFNGLHFEGSQYRLNNYRSNTVQWYLYDDTFSVAPFRGSIKHSPPTSFNQNPDEIYNVVKAIVNVREVAATVTQVWNFGSSITLGASQSVTIYAHMDEPVKEAVTPLVGTDYQVSAGSLSSVVLEFTGGARIGITLTAGAGGALVIGPPGQESGGLYLRAKVIAKVAESNVISTFETSISINRYQTQETILDVWPEVNYNTIQDVVNGVVRRYKDPRAQLTLNVYNTDIHSALFILRCTISDRVHIQVTHQGIDSDYFIETKEIKALGNGLVQCTIGCEIVIDEDAFRFGVDKFGENVFA